MSSLFEAGSGPLLFAHRGAAEHWPENSLQAFTAALDVGADVLEIDVHMTRDRQIVVAHDRDGARTAGVQRAIAKCSLAEVRTWDLRVGAPGGSASQAPVRVPTLGEVLTAFPTTPLNVDVKPRDPQVVAPLLELLAQHAASDRVLLTSFDARALGRIRAAGYAGPTGLARREVARLLLGPLQVARMRAPAGYRMQIPVAFAAMRLDLRAHIERAHRLGLAVDYWVVNGADEAERLLDMGADGVVTDYPDRLAPVFAQHVRCRGYRARHPGVPGSKATTSAEREYRS